MSQYTGDIYLRAITYASGDIGYNFKFDFNLQGRVHTLYAMMELGSTLPFNELLGSEVLPSDPTSLTMIITVTEISRGYSISRPQVLTIRYDPPEQSFTMFVDGEGMFLFDVGVTVIAPPATGVLTPCDMVRRIPDIYTTLLDASQMVPNFTALDPVVQIGTLTGHFQGTKNTIVSQLRIDPTTVNPAGEGFFGDLRASFDVASLAYSATEYLDAGTLAQVDGFISNVAIQTVRLQDEYLPYPYPSYPPVANACAECKVWTEMLNCLCKLCAEMSSLPSDVQGKLNETLQPQIDGLYAMVGWLSGQLRMAVVPGWYINTPCNKLKAVASFYANLCNRCASVDSALLAESRFYFDQMRVKYEVLRRMLATRGIQTCGSTGGNQGGGGGIAPKDLPRCGKQRYLPIAYQLMQSGSHDPSFANLGPVRSITDSFTEFEPVRAAIVGELGLSGPISSPDTTTFLGRLDNTLSVLGVGYLNSSRLAPTTLRRMDQYFGALQGNVSDATAIWLPNPNPPSTTYCTLCAEWLDVLTCLCRLCDSPDQICGGIPGGIDALLRPEIDSLYALALPKASALGIPAASMGSSSSSCGKLQGVFSVIAMICQKCSSPDTAFLNAVTPHMNTLRSKVDAFKSTPALACCAICDTSCVAWMGVLGCLSDLCRQGSSFSEQTRAQILAIFGAKVDRLWWVLFPTAPVVTVTFDVTCGRVPQIMETLPAVLCSPNNPPSAYTKSQLEILLLDFQNGLAELRPKLAASGISLCQMADCECCTVQSPYIYLQAAGSDGSDGSSPGVHLRWGLLKKLGQEHLPKGNLSGPGGVYPTTIGFNKGNDFVNIYRAPYPTRYAASVATTAVPNLLTESGAVREWTYQNLQADGQSAITSLVVRFADIPRYDQVRATINPSVQPQNFLRTYASVIELEAKGKLSFAAEISVTRINAGAMSLQAEAISQLPNADKADPVITLRRQYDSPGTSPNVVTHRIVSESIQRIRFRCVNCFPSMLLMETYADFYGAVTRRRQWVQVGNFALSVNDTEVSNRLNNAPSNNVNNLWPKYNDGAKVKTANYMDRWSSPGAPQDGLKTAVVEYLQRSRTDLMAKATFSSELLGPGQHTPPDGSKVEISYLDALKFISLDFHAARMLGLGHIDATVTSPTQKYIYMAEYFTTVPIDSVVTGAMRHIFLSLPTGRTDYRLPATPDLDPLSFGLRVPNGTDEGALITDAQGYTPNDDKRFINVNRAPLKFDLPVGGFFDDSAQFSRDANTRPVAYGIEYRKSGEPSWRKPELSNDPEYLDTAGIAETVPITDQPNPLFIHRESEEGTHEYGIYGINWFSRVSPLGTQIRSASTMFPNRCTLQPPTSLAVQYVQAENPRIFTTLDEQNTKLGKTRVTFYWTHINNIAYTRDNPSARAADRVEFYFRASGPKLVRGEVIAVAEMPDGTLKLSTGPVPQGSRGPGLDIRPEVASADTGRYVGSILMTPTGQFVVTSVTASSPGVGATFYVRPAKKNALVDVDGNNTFIATDGESAPMVGDRFIVAENLLDPAAWLRLSRTVTLHNFAPLYKETVTHEDGSTTILPMGGIFAKATINHLGDGIYEVLFGSYVLPLHPAGDTAVDWYKGVARVQKLGGSEFKDLETWRLETDGANPLKIHIYDPDYATAPIRTGANIDVNFHPGYRLYLSSESGFGTGEIMPASGEGTRYTYLGAAAYDADLGCRSAISTPVMLMAREETPPVTPSTPTGPAFATRPDFYGKATYTFDTIVNPGGTNPFALIFHRANERSILDAIYQPATVDAILAALAGLREDAFDQGWRDLVAGVIGGDGKFKTYAGYRLPNPDRVRTSADPSDYPSFNGSDPGTSIGGGRRVIDDVLVALQQAFTPLTERPVVYDYIRSGSETSNEKPVIRNANGDLLSPLDGAYNPSPMARKLSAGTVRFTDYTLDGAARNIYFYYVVGMSNKMEMSARSGILGPVHLLNTNPPEAPVITYVESRPATPLGGVATVLLRINPYPDVEGVVKVRLYRALGAAEAASIRSMKLLGTYDAGEELADDFSDLSSPPFGDPIYYRVVALRRIINEQNQEEYVPSVPSKGALASIVDTVNPLAPELSYTPGSGSTPSVLKNVTLSWPTEVRRGTYYLYRMTDSGAWKMIYQITPDLSATTASYPPAGDFTGYPETAELVKSSGGRTFYHRFKVVAENSSGLQSLQEKVLTI